MRIDRLDLERYGHFDGTSLDLSSADARLHIVHGRNEAGKSTALSAICDLLFGVPERSGLGFRHGNNALRIGAALRLADGRVLEVKRRKGRTSTLLDADGAALPDNLLAPHLGGVDRAGFERLFGLDHERLRQGGDAMLAAGGDLAQTLFQVGSGLSGLKDVAARLVREADEIGSPHRKQASKPLWQAVEAHGEAAARMRNEATKADAWDAAVTAVETARAQLSALREGLAQAQKRRSRLERLRRVRPLLARLDDLTAALLAAGTGPDLPDGLLVQWRHAETDLLSAERQAQATRAEAEAAEAALAEAGTVPALLDLAARIEALYQRQGEIAKARADLPRRRQDREQALHRLERAARDIGLSPDMDRLEKGVPDRLLIARIRDRVKAHARLDQSLADIRRREEMAAAAARQAERLHGPDAPDPKDLSAAEAAFTAAQRLGEVELRLARAERAEAEGNGKLAQAVARLGRFARDADRLVALPLPTFDAVDQQRQRETALETRRQRLADDRRQLEEEARRHRQTLRELKADGEVPTPAAIADARRQRDLSWAGLRPLLESGGKAPADAVPGFEHSLRTADLLADQREQEATRVARYVRAEADLAACLERLDDLDRDVGRLETEAAALAAEWAGMWRASGIEPGNPAEMAAFLTQTAAVLTAREQQGQLAEAMAALKAEEELCRRHLTQALVLCGLDVPSDSALSTLRTQAEAAVTRARQASDAAARTEQERQRTRLALEQARADHEQALADLTAWRDGWAADMDAIGLPPQSGPAEAEAALSSWEDIAGELRELHGLDHRIVALEKDIALYAAEALSLAADAQRLAAHDGLPDDVQLLPGALFSALAAAREQAARRQVLAQRRIRAQEALQAAEQDLSRARNALSDLRHLHRLSAQDDVPALVTAAGNRRALRQQEAALLAELAQASDGLDLAQLRTDVAGVDPDAVTAEAMALAAEIERQQTELPEISARLRDAERALEELRRKAGIGGAAQDAADAAARAAAAAGRWLRLRAASLLLSQAVERYRDRNEHPLLIRAGQILATMAATGGNPIQRLKVDYGDADHPVLVGVRADRSDLGVEGMSEGTRDQLYLALRIAAVEAHIRQSTPLPFVADDLFITSDEARTAAGLRALAELGGATQVVLFTHHEYVVQAASATLGDAACIHRLV